MANIGEILAKDDETAGFQQTSVGAAVEGQAALPDDEVTRSPAFKKNLEWMRKNPENLMTALVFLGSVIQPRTGNRNGLQTFAQRGLGALAFRSELNDLNRKDAMENAEAARRQQAVDAEIVHRKAQIDVARDQVDATNRNTEADLMLGRQRLGTEQQMLREQMDMRWAIANLDANTARTIASMEARLKQTGGMPELLTADDIKSAVDLVKNSTEAGTPVTLGQALGEILRPKFLIMSKMHPELAGLLTLTEKELPGIPVMPTAAPRKEPSKKPESKPTYKSAPMQYPAMGLPNPMLGQSYGVGPHEAPPQKYPGK